MTVKQRTITLSEFELETIEHFSKLWHEGFSVSLRRIIREFKIIKDAEEKQEMIKQQHQQQGSHQMAINSPHQNEPHKQQQS